MVRHLFSRLAVLAIIAIASVNCADSPAPGESGAQGDAVVVIYPGSGPSAGGTSVTVTGAAFTDTVTVLFDGAVGQGASVTASGVTVTSPPGDPGPATVTVLDGGVFVGSTTFEYEPGPLAIAGVSPAVVSRHGGEWVSIVGSQFDAQTVVSFGGALALDTELVSHQALRAQVPSLPPGPVEVRLSRADSEDAVWSGLTVDAAIGVASIEPATGGTGTRVTLYGYGFTADVAVLVGEQRAEDVQVLSPVELHATIPDLSPGAYPLVVLADGVRVDVGVTWSHVALEPVVTAVVPSVAQPGDEVQIRGSGFASPAQVTIGGSPARVTEVAATRITAVVPAGALGDVTVSVVIGELEPVVSEGLLHIVVPDDPTAPAPALASVVAEDPYYIVVEFTEPMGPSADLPSRYEIIVHDAPEARLVVLDVTREDDTRFGLTTLPQWGTQFDLRVGGVASRAGVPIRFPEAEQLEPGQAIYFDRARFVGLDESPTEAGAAQRELRLSGTDWPDLPCVTCDSDRDCGASESCAYGRCFAAGEPVLGAATSAIGFLPPTDSDCDGVADVDEQAGSMIHVERVGRSDDPLVTSDPFLVDTDGDRLSDADEALRGINPRSSDTDGDSIPDADEARIWLSDPADVDTDGDGLTEAAEVFWDTSFIFADTDGDGIDDRTEVLEGSLAPDGTRAHRARLADIPAFRSLVGTVNLSMNVTYEYTDEDGETVSQAREFSSSHETSTSTSWGSTLGGSASVGLTAGSTQTISADPSVDISEEVSLAAEVNWGFTLDSSRSATDAYNESVSAGSELTTSSSVTRSVDGGTVSVGVTFSVDSDERRAFTVQHIEITLLHRDPFADRDSFTAVATLVPASTLATGEPLEVNLGPLARSRGPILFQSSLLFASQLEAMMKHPEALTAVVSNYQIIDSEGRTFLATSEQVANRSSTVVINDGLSVPRTVRIASTGRFDPATGQPVGISLVEALGALGYVPWSEVSGGALDYRLFDQDGVIAANDAPPVGCTAALAAQECPSILGSFGLGEVAPGGRQVLSRVGAVGSALDDSGVPTMRTRAWQLIHNDVTLSDGADIRDVFLTPGASYILGFTADADGDGIPELIEAAHGARDNTCDSDGDGLSDPLEITGVWRALGADGGPPLLDCDPALLAGPGAEGGASVPWGVTVRESATSGGRTRIAHASPRDTDSDGDGIDDRTEYESLGTDPRDADTDRDGLTDFAETRGVVVSLLYVPDPPPAGGLHDCADPALLTSWPDALLPPRLFGTRCYVATSDPLVRDTDGDGIEDGRETRLGLQPRFADAGRFSDADGDGLVDELELLGWLVAADATRPAGEVCAANGVAVRPDPELADSDADGLGDYVEFVLGTNPNARDTDCDGLSDYDEWDHATAGTASSFAALVDTCSRVRHCGFNPEDSRLLGTAPLRQDTDGEGLTDDRELIGWSTRQTTPTGGVTFGIVFPDPRLEDTDGDGMSDADEYLYRSNPRAADTDGDGISDAAEVAVGRNPVLEELLVHVEVVAIENFVSGGFWGDDNIYVDVLPTRERVEVVEPGETARELGEPDSFGVCGQAATSTNECYGSATLTGTAVVPAAGALSAEFLLPEGGVAVLSGTHQEWFRSLLEPFQRRIDRDVNMVGFSNEEWQFTFDELDRLAAPELHHLVFGAHSRFTIEVSVVR